MRRVAIVQARFASTRLPGKVMLTLGEHSVLSEVLTRCRAIPGVDEVCCAVSDGAAADILADEAERAGARVFIGSEQDVLQRYLGAARMTEADEILRVTSDCPLIDPQLCADVLDARARAQADYCANNFEAGFPHGLDCEAFTRAALERAAAMASAAYDREHVGPLMRRSPEFRRAGVTSQELGFAAFRWTLDYLDDYLFLHAVFRRLAGARPPWLELARDLARTPLPSLNAAAGRREETRA